MFRCFLGTTFTSAFLSYFAQTYWNDVYPSIAMFGISAVGAQTMDWLFYGIDAFVIFCLFGTLVSGAIMMANQTGGY